MERSLHTHTQYKLREVFFRLLSLFEALTAHPVWELCIFFPGRWRKDIGLDKIQATVGSRAVSCVFSREKDLKTKNISICSGAFPKGISLLCVGEHTTNNPKNNFFASSLCPSYPSLPTHPPNIPVLGGRDSTKLHLRRVCQRFLLLLFNIIRQKY